MESKVYIIVVNYNGWQDTIECLESVFRIRYPRYEVILIDNGSIDNSLEYITRWADGDGSVWKPQNNFFCFLFESRIEKPIQHVMIDVSELREGISTYDSSVPRLLMLRTEKNIGFAGGNNIGIQCAVKKDDYEYIWVLNNDTVVEKDALTALIEYNQTNPGVGIVGSKLLYYNNPTIIQAVGGRLNRWFATTSHLGEGERDIAQWDKEVRLDYVPGASFFISKKCVDKIGLLSEEYFMYMEDTDYCYRARYNGIKSGYAYNSRVYHKVGASFFSSGGRNDKSYLIDTISLRNRLRFAKKHLKPYLPTIYGGLFISFILRIIRGQKKSAFYILKLIFRAEH